MFNISKKPKLPFYHGKPKTGIVYQTMPEPGSKDRILVLVAHPDDEWLSCFGFLERAVKNGARVKVVIATLGEWSRAYSYLDSGRMKNFFASLGKKRAKETLLVMKKIDLKNQDVVFLGYPGGHLQTIFKKNWAEAFFVNYLKSDKVIFDFAYEPGAVFSGERLYESIKKIIFEFKPNTVITHSPLDVHKDHKTIYWLVKDSLEELKLKPETYFFLIHNRGYSFSGKNALNHHLEPPKRFLRQEFAWHSFELNKGELRDKKTSMLKYKTQLKNPYLNILLNSFCKQNELFYSEK